MTTILSTPTSVAVQAIGTSPLAVLAASMAPGTWARLNGVSSQDSVLGVGPVSGTAIDFGNSAPWNPVSKTVEIVGADHGYNRARHMQYVESSNSFVLVSDDATLENNNHVYDHTAVNPYNGDIYHRDYGESSPFFERRSIGGSFSRVSPDFKVDIYLQDAIGSCYWSGSFSGGGGAGAQGAYFVFNSGNSTGTTNDGQIVAYSPTRAAWFFNQSGLAPNYGSGSTYHSVMEYSPVLNCAVFGGGNAAPQKLWRLNSDGTSVRLKDVPSGKRCGIQAGNLCTDPVTGKFLLLSGGQLWELDPFGAGSPPGTWIQKTSPPGGLNPDSATKNPPDAVLSSSIGNYGVVAYVQQTSSTGGTFYLYKNA